MNDLIMIMTIPIGLALVALLLIIRHYEPIVRKQRGEIDVLQEYRQYKSSAKLFEIRSQNYERLYKHAVQVTKHKEELMDEIKSSKNNIQEKLEEEQREHASAMWLLSTLSDNRAYTRTSPERHWRRQDKLMELKFRNPDGSYEQF